MPKTKKPLFSIIVPAFKKEKTIKKDLHQIENAVKQAPYRYEIICVVDGYVDKTKEKAKQIKSRKIKVIGYEKNKGKGHAVRYGMARAQGDPIAFIDAGMEIDPSGINMILAHMEWYDADIIVGSKRHPASQVDYPFERKIISRAYQLFVRIFTGLNIRDTQAGLKVFRRRVLEDVLPRLLVKEYAFDLEMLSVANRLGYKRIYEAPIRISYNFQDLTHAATREAMLRALNDTLAIIYRLRILRYYDDHNKKKWHQDGDLIINNQ